MNTEHAIDTTTLTSTIGVRVRRERIAREWTLDQLADAAGISRRQIVNLEQGDANPSIGTLLKLSEALGISLAALVEPPSSRTVRITRSGDGAQLWTGSRGGRGVLLVGTHPPDVVELWDWQMNPGDRHESTAHPPGTRELLHVHTGTVTIDVATEHHELTSGDAILFPGDVPHAYSNQAASPAQFSLSVYEPHPGSPHARKDSHA